MSQSTENTLIGKIRKMPGFLVPDTHFRIGSKIHISKFYYTKRFFQNSFYATRIAFLVSRDIITRHGPRIEDYRKVGITLVGYGQYSELFLNLVAKFLRTNWEISNEEDLNYNVFNENMELVKKETIHNNVIIIVPIATTFSTSIKMEEEVRKLNTEAFPIGPHINVIHIYHSPSRHELGMSPLELQFGWRKKNLRDKIIKVHSNFDKDHPDKYQKYFFGLPSIWSNQSSCGICFPSGYHKELPLYETDKSSVTPAFIFNFPKGREIREKAAKWNFKLLKEHFRYGHHWRSGNHFHFYMRANLFLKDNLPLVGEWLQDVKKSVAFRKLYSSTDHVLLLASGHHSNASFVDLVNERIFSNAATIIHYNPSSEYVQNFRSIYKSDVLGATKIFFIDDALNSGRTFHAIKNSVEYIIKNDGTGGQKMLDHCLTGCFFLLNGSSDFDFQSLSWNFNGVDSIFSFADMHLPTASTSDGTSPLFIEQNKYLSLVDESYLDSLKVYFLKQADKLKVTTDADDQTEKREKNARRHLGMLIATHCLFDFFRKAKDPFAGAATLQMFVKKVLAETHVPVANKDAEIDFRPGGKDWLSFIECCFLKVLTQYPFIQYKPVRDEVFKWVLALLHNRTTELDNQEDLPKFLTYEKFREFKFLIRRAGLLGCNILISKVFFDVVMKLMEGDILSNMIKKEASRKPKGKIDEIDFDSVSVAAMEENVNDFYIFLVAQIKELLFNNEARTIKLEKLFEGYAQTGSLKFQQFIRILNEESNMLIDKFYKFLASRVDWATTITPDIDEKFAFSDIEYDNSAVEKFLTDSSVSDTYRYSIFKEYLELLEKQVSRKTVLDYLWVKHFLDMDFGKNQSKVGLIDKTAILMDKLKELVTDSDCGAFLLINHASDRGFVVYNKGESYGGGIDTEYLENLEGDGYFREFNMGCVDNAGINKKTLVELKRKTVSDNSKGWVDMYLNTEGAQKFLDLPWDIVPESCNRIILVRITKLIKGKIIPQGLLGFYHTSEQGEDEVTPTKRVNFLLLVRGSISTFITLHHENEEFRELQLNMHKQKTALLTGHGREMLISISLQAPQVFRSIISTLLMVQRFILDKKETFKPAVIDSDKIDEIFWAYYSPGKTDRGIDETSMSRIKNIAEEVFKLPQIEAQLEANVKVLPEDLQELRFPFSKDLFDFFCFELLLNAKKNRWIFMDDEDIEYPDGTKFINNDVFIEVKQGDNTLEVTISNTGPAVKWDIINKLNAQESVKDYDSSSGIELIQTVLREFRLGEITFGRSDKAIFDEVYLFIAKLTLKPISRA